MGSRGWCPSSSHSWSSFSTHLHVIVRTVDPQSQTDRETNLLNSDTPRVCDTAEDEQNFFDIDILTFPRQKCLNQRTVFLVFAVGV